MPTNKKIIHVEIMIYIFKSLFIKYYFNNYLKNNSSFSTNSVNENHRNP